MDRRWMLPALAAGLPGGSASGAPFSNAFAQAFLKSFIEHWNDTREYTLAVLDAMPEDKFTSKPVPAQRTFGEQLLHLAAANKAYFKGFGMPIEEETIATPDPAKKSSVRAHVLLSFDLTMAVLKRMTEKDLMRTDIKFSPRSPAHSAVDIFLRAYMHTAHHRGQIITYLRVNNITPPTWKFEPHL